MSGDGMVVRERLPLGGDCELVADAGGWRLEFWFHPSDMRYRSDHLVVSSAGLAAFRQSLQEAGRRYLAIRPSTPDPAKVEQRFGDVTMRIGGSFDGVCLGGWRALFRDEEGMRSALELLDRVPGRGGALVAGIRRAEAVRPEEPGTPATAPPTASAAPLVVPRQPVLRPPRADANWRTTRRKPRASRLSRIALFVAVVLSLALAAAVVAERRAVPQDIPRTGPSR